MSAVQQLLTDHIDIWTAAETEKKTGRGRASGNAASVYGIKKLRELILELAVRGKLVPQDANDESASMLFKRIQAEKAKLIFEGKIRKDTSLPPITDDEKPFDLPNGWEWVRLGHISGIERGGSPRPIKSFITNDPDGLNWIKIGDTDQGGKYITSTDEKIRKEGLSNTRMVYPGDFLLTNSMSFGRPYITKIEGCIHDGWLRISPPEALDKDFLYLLLSSPYVRKMFIASAAGAVVQNLNAEKVRDLLIPVTPLPEQHRIVAKVDELMVLCDQLENQHSNAAEAHEILVSHLLGTLTQSQSAEDFSANWQRIAAHFDALFTTDASIYALKQTLLQLAVMGKLVPQDPADIPACALLSRKKAIAEERIPFKIPDSWSWARVDEFAQTRLGKMLDKAKNKGVPVRYLRNINVRWSNFDLSDVKEMRFETSELEEFALRRGDVLICEGGYPGRAAVWDERETNIYFQKAIHRVRFQNGISPYYFVNVLRESADSGRLNSYFTGAGIQHFTGKGLMSFLVPLPPISEQSRIVAKVDELMALCDQLKSRITDARQLQQQLADVMVEQAVA